MCNKEVISPGECFLLTKTKCLSADYKTLWSHLCFVAEIFLCYWTLSQFSTLSTAFLPWFLAMAREHFNIGDMM